MGRLNSLFDRYRHSPGRKIVVSFTTKYALPRQIKPRILELSIRRRQSNSSIVLTFVSCEEIDCYRGVVSAGQLGATAARTINKLTNVMTKFIVDNRTGALQTDINLLFTITNCRYCPLSLADSSHEFQIHMSVRILTIKISQ